jgi:hypothetical protein
VRPSDAFLYEANGMVDSGEDSEPMPGSDAPFLAEAGPSTSRTDGGAASQLIMSILYRLLVSTAIAGYVLCSLSLSTPFSPRTRAESLAGLVPCLVRLRAVLRMLSSRKRTSRHKCYSGTTLRQDMADIRTMPSGRV